MSISRIKLDTKREALRICYLSPKDFQLRVLNYVINESLIYIQQLKITLKIYLQIDMPGGDPCNESLSKMELDVLKFQKSLTAKKGLTALKMPTVHYDPNSSQENVNPTLSAVS